jgi:hypothetical protein
MIELSEPCPTPFAIPDGANVPLQASKLGKNQPITA